MNFEQTNAGDPRISRKPAARNGDVPEPRRSDSAPEERVEVRIPASPRYIVVVRQTVEALCEELLMPPMDCAAVRLAVGEACNNAVLHASAALPPAAAVTVVCHVREDSLEIDVANAGGSYLPSLGAKMPDPLSENGRGIALIEAMMDSVDYMVQDDHTVVRMRKSLPAAPPESA